MQLYIKWFDLCLSHGKNKPRLVSNLFFFINSILMDILYSFNQNQMIVTKHTTIINIQAHNYYKYDENKKSPDHIALNAQLCE
jgi:hypothetical protein